MMSGEQKLERSVLEGKERENLHAIAEALGQRPVARAKKADLIDIILRAAGVEDGPVVAARPRRAPRRRVSEVAAESTTGELALDPPVADEPAPEPPAVAPLVIESSVDAPPVVESPVVESPVVESSVVAESSVAESFPAESSPVDESSSPSVRPSPSPVVSTGPAGPGNQALPPAPIPTQGNQPHQPSPGVLSEGDVRRNRRRRGRDRDRPGGGFDQQATQADQVYAGEPLPCQGVLDLRPEGYGFLRTNGYLTSADDVYVSVSQVRRFDLRAGDRIVGTSRPATTQERFAALQRIDTVSGQSPDEARRRPRFENLTPVWPHERLRLEQAGLAEAAAATTARIVDLLAPIGKGQRVLLVAPPKAGVTTVLTHLAMAIEALHPEVVLTVLLVSERPEEVTALRRRTQGQVIGSAFDRPAEEHTQIAELVVEEAKRQVELGRDVVVLLDGVTRLARAYGATDPAKGLFGAARCVEEGGSLTIVATTRSAAGSTEEAMVLQELASAANAEVHLDGHLADRRRYPALDVNHTATGHEELLFTADELPLAWQLRRALVAAEEAGPGQGNALLLKMLKDAPTNAALLAQLAGTTGDPLPLEGSL